MKRYTRREVSFAAAALAGLGFVGQLTGVAAQSATPATGATPSGDGSEITVKHAQGETVVSANPATVISFDLASVDTLDALGVAISGLPKGSLAGHLDKFNADDYLNAGTLFEPDYEAVFGAKPDLIIVAGRSAAAYPELAKIAPTLDLTPSGTDFIADLKTNATILGEIFGKQAEVADALAALDQRVATLKADAEGVGSGLVIMTTGGEVTAVAPGGTGRGSRGALIYTTLGIAPPIDDIAEATHGEAVSFEFLLEANPDWLFVIDRDAATGSEEGKAAAEILDNELVAQTTAATAGQIVYLDPYTWYIVGNGLTTAGLMIEQLETAFAG